jgi:segregation and condensation protein B
LFATTKQFLDDLGLASLDQLPLLDTPAEPMGSFSHVAAEMEAALLAVVPGPGDKFDANLQFDMPLDNPALDAAPTVNGSSE